MSMPPEKKNPLGPTGEEVRRNVKRRREDLRLSYRELSDRLADKGRRIPTLGLSRIENGERRIDVDDLVALAAALRVSPSNLLFGEDIRREIEVTGVGRIPGRDVWAWADRKELPRVAESDRDQKRAEAEFYVASMVAGIDGPQPLSDEQKSRFLSNKADTVDQAED